MLPKVVKRWYIRLVAPVFLLLYPLVRKVLRLDSMGVRVIVVCDREMLFVKPIYHDHYTFPGGRAKRGEDPEDTARRELREETGIELSGLEFIETVTDPDGYCREVHLFLSYVQSKQVEVDGVEIERARWSTIDNLPPVEEETEHLLSLCEQTLGKG